MSDNSSSNFFALLAGVAIGAAVGVLFAPESGKQTRQKLKDGASKYTDELENQLQALNGKLKPIFERAAGSANESVDALLDSAHTESEDLIARLEARLEQLKSKLAEHRNDT